MNAKITANCRMILALGIAVVLAGGQIPARVASQDGNVMSPLTEELDPTPVVDWMMLFYRLAESEAVSAPAASRLYAYAGITVYESLRPGMPHYHSLAGQIGYMPLLPQPQEGVVYDWLSTCNGAMATVAERLFSNSTPQTYQAIADLRRAQADARAAVVGAAVVERSLELGVAMGRVLLDWAAQDGYAEWRGRAFVLPEGEGLWVPTTAGAPPIGPYWGRLRPFVLPDADHCAVALNVPYSTDPESTFYLQAMEVVETGRNLTPEQKEIARYWIGKPGASGTPAGHWLSIANQLVVRLDLPLDRAAEMYAMVGMALGDAFISAWSLKYQVNLLRPVTYIRANIDPNWSTYVETPSFPEYPSGHSVVSAAAAEVLTELFGGVAFTDETHLIYDHEPLRRSFTTFEAAATEAAMSRLYGGIHYRSAIENGMRQGRCIGQQVSENVRLRSGSPS